MPDDKKKRIKKLKAAREATLKSASGPQGGGGKAAREKRMKTVKSYDKAIIAAGGKVEPLGKAASNSTFRNADYIKIRGKR